MIASLALVVLIAGGAMTFVYGRSQLEPVSPSHGRVVSIQVVPGETAGQVTDNLAAKGVIRSRFWFGLYANARNLSAHLRPGMFQVDDGMGASAIISVLEGEPSVATIRIVLPEGLTAQQMAGVVGKSGLKIAAADYLDLATHPQGFTGALLADLPVGAPLEGFLFPATYDVPANATAKDVIQMQLDNFDAKARAALRSSTLSPYQTLVLASIIEREARFDVDRPLVAGVITNRLADGMDLQVDASVLYGLGVTGRSPTGAELGEDTPYNTYLHAGLPPTPISNPGLSSIRAAAQPAQTADLFYVSDREGHNHYSVTAAEHTQQCVQFLGRSC